MKTEIKTITPELAKEILQKNKRNRPISDRIVSYYADQMKRGQWMLNGEGIIISDGGILLNGQHRLYAVIESGATIETLFITDVPDETFVTMDQGKTRTAGDVFGTLGITNPNNTAAIVSAYLVMKSNRKVSGSDGVDFRQLKKSKADILNAYNEYPELFNAIMHFSVKLYQKSRMMRVSEIGSYMAYLVIDKKHSQAVVWKFFNQLFGYDNASNSTITMLRDKLINARLSNYKLTSKYKRAIFTKTWNAYLSGQELKSFRWNEKTDTMPEFM